MPNVNRRQARPARRASTVAILPYGASDSVNALKEALVAQDVAATKLRREGSTFRGREADLIVNWGNSTIGGAAFNQIVGNARVLNKPAAIATASHKVRAFEAMQGAGNVPLTEFTTDQAVAQGWMDEGGVVYARTRLQGHSGEGIVVCSQNALPDLGDIQTSGELVRAPLYTKGITAQRREFRAHVMNGVITYIQQKKREDNYRNNPNYSNVVRNYHTGWIYATANINMNQAANDSAIAAINALGLDFGAVDIITRGNDAWVLEVNTAPGLQGTNLATYADNLARIFRNEEVVHHNDRRAEAEAVVDAGLEELAQEIADQVVPPPAQVPFPHAEALAELREEVLAGVPHPRQVEIRQAANILVNAGEARMARVQQVVAPVQAVEPLVDQVAVGRGDPQPALRDKSLYIAMINGSRTAVQYEAGVNQFYMIGWDMPFNIEDVELIQEV